MLGYFNKLIIHLCLNKCIVNMNIQIYKTYESTSY